MTDEKYNPSCKKNKIKLKKLNKPSVSRKSFFFTVQMWVN